MKNRLQLSLVLVCMVLGFLLATSFNTQQRNSAALNTPRKQTLIKTIHALELQRDRLKVDIEAERAQIAKYEKRAAENEGILSQYTKDLEKVRLIAGLTEVKGSGVIVTLADNQNYPLNDDPNNYVIHDYDVRQVVNSLWAGGAEAIAVNNQRLIATSSIRCAGSTILVNSTRLVSPYSLRAVGNPARLIKALETDAQTKRLFNEIKTYYGLTADIKQSDDISIPAYSGGLLVENAKAIGGAE